MMQLGLAPLPSLDSQTAAVQPDTTQSAGFVMDEGDPALPDHISAVPRLRDGELPAVAQTPASTQPAGRRQMAAAAPTLRPPPGDASQADAAHTAGDGRYIENLPPGAARAAVPTQTETRRRGFLATLFSPAPAQAAPLFGAGAPQAPRPVVELASAGPSPSQPSARTAYAEPLPGVRQKALFDISRKSGLADDSDIDINESDGPVEVASAAGMARLAPNGLLTQTGRVDVACLKPSLVRMLKAIEGHYGKQVVVTSGYRDPDDNRRAHGARNSLHMYCAAADIQVSGVTKWELASYVRSMPGRGGVGTYCYTKSVHVDIGPERDWNWRCRRRK